MTRVESIVNVTEPIPFESIYLPRSVPWPYDGWQQHKAAPVSATHTLESQGHGWPRTKGTSRDVGGDFLTHRLVDFHLYDHRLYETYRESQAAYRLQYYPTSPYDAAKSVMYLTAPPLPKDLAALGATAISRCIPTNPVVDGSTALGELLTGLPKIPAKALLKTKFKESREYGSEFLNIQFGWLPLVSDLKKLSWAVMESDRILSQMRRDSGRMIRRQYEFPQEIVNETGQIAQHPWLASGPIHPYHYLGGGVLHSRTKVTVQTRFSGAFTYYVELGKDFESKLKRFMQEARKLYGLELTPEVAWNLTPFSWLTDWYANTGDVLSNISRFSQDGLVMPYGYIMQQRDAEVEYTYLGGGLKSRTQNTGTQRMILRSTSKSRQRANPFGFGVTMASLTGRQSAILAALGLAQGRR